MSSNVGLSTPRGSGTSGYVQRNLSALKSRDYGQPYPDPKKDFTRPHRQPDKQILEHDRKREIEVKVFALRDNLEDEGKLDEDEIDERCDKLRTELLEEMEQGRSNGSAKGSTGKGLKRYQVHELAEAKEREMERFRRAVGVKEGAEERLWDKEKRTPMAEKADDTKPARSP